MERLRYSYIKSLFEKKTLDEKEAIYLLKHFSDALNYIPSHMLNDRNFAIEVVKIDGMLLGRLPDDLHWDKEVVSYAVRENPMAIKFADQSLLHDEEIMKVARDSYANYLKNIRKCN